MATRPSLKAPAVTSCLALGGDLPVELLVVHFAARELVSVPAGSRRGASFRSERARSAVYLAKQRPGDELVSTTRLIRRRLTSAMNAASTSLPAQRGLVRRVRNGPGHCDSATVNNQSEAAIAAGIFTVLIRITRSCDFVHNEYGPPWKGLQWRNLELSDSPESIPLGFLPFGGIRDFFRVYIEDVWARLRRTRRAKCNLDC